MVSDRIFELCEPVLQDSTITDEDKTDKLEDLLKKELGLTGKALEDAVLGALWRQRGSDGGAIRTTVVRRSSPAPWQQVSRPTASPRSASGTPSGLGPNAPLFKRAKSSTASPSPRPSPRLNYATPQIPHSPSLSTYQFSDPSQASDSYVDMGSDGVDWLVNDDASSTTSWGDSSVNGPASDFMQPVSVDMTPFDIIRSVLRDERSDEELNSLLEANGYDLSQTISSLMENQPPAEMPTQAKTYLVGKSLSPSSRPMTPVGQAKTPVVCRYYLASGHCARADCRFSHDLTNHLCKYWLAGNCFAGDSCMFSHDPSILMSRLSVEPGTDSEPAPPPSFQIHDFDLFPALKRADSNLSQTISTPPQGSPKLSSSSLALSAMNPNANFVPSNFRPATASDQRATTPSGLTFQDDESFPTLGFAAATKAGKKHHGKRGHGHATQRETPISTPSSLADVVRMSPAPSSPIPMVQTRRGLRPMKSFNGGEGSAAAQAIAPPEHIPWLETGEDTNRAYLKARAEAFRHGGLRNKFLQGAAQAWNRNDARGAKALSSRGQNENALMKEAHREAARVLYEERNKASGSGKELYVDLHGTLIPVMLSI